MNCDLCGRAIRPGTSETCMYCYRPREERAAALAALLEELQDYMREPGPWTLVESDRSFPQFGAYWLRDCGDYADRVELYDMEDATGEPCYVVEFGSVGLYGHPENLETAADSWCDGIDSLLAIADPAARRLAAFRALAGYGYGDAERLVYLVTRPRAWREYRAKHGPRWEHRDVGSELVTVRFGDSSVRRWLAGEGLPMPPE